MTFWSSSWSPAGNLQWHWRPEPAQPATDQHLHQWTQILTEKSTADSSAGPRRMFWLGVALQMAIFYQQSLYLGSFWANTFTTDSHLFPLYYQSSRYNSKHPLLLEKVNQNMHSSYFQKKLLLLLTKEWQRRENNLWKAVTQIVIR